jgi:hypothetical protein
MVLEHVCSLQKDAQCEPDWIDEQTSHVAHESPKASQVHELHQKGQAEAEATKARRATARILSG